MKKIFLTVFIISIFSNTYFFSQERIPVIIKSQNKIFQQISKDIKKNLPDQIEILVYDINFLNAAEDTAKNINLNFKNLISADQFNYGYTVFFISDLEGNKFNISQDSIKKQSDLELIEIGKYLEKDAVMLSSISFVKNKRRKVWNKTEKKFEPGEIALFQGNFFSTINNNSLYRFSYYFILDKKF